MKLENNTQSRKTKRRNFNHSKKPNNLHKMIKLKHNLTQKYTPLRYRKKSIKTKDGGSSLDDIANSVKGRFSKTEPVAVPVDASQTNAVNAVNVQPVSSISNRLSQGVNSAASAAKDAATGATNFLGNVSSRLMQPSAPPYSSQQAGIPPPSASERRNSYETQLTGGALPDDLQRKLFESICSNMNNLFVKNSANFQSTINVGLKSLLETEDIKGQFQTAVVSMFDSFAKDEATKRLMNDKIEAQILTSVANHIQSKLPSDIRASVDDIKNIIMKYPEVMSKMSSPSSSPPANPSAEAGYV
jgi:hypothetical protein